MVASSWNTKAKQLLSAVEDTDLSQEERQQKAVELASFILRDSELQKLPEEIEQTERIGKLLKNPMAKTLITSMVDQAFRSKDPQRVTNQLIYLIEKFGIPDFLASAQKIRFKILRAFGSFFPSLIVPSIIRSIRKTTSQLILPGESDFFTSHLKLRREENISINLKRIGEAINGEEEARRSFRTYLDDLANPDIECISIQLSALYSQINLLSWQDTIKILTERLRLLYYVASHNTYTRKDGTEAPKFVYLDTEEHPRLLLIIEVFHKVLSDNAFIDLPAGIVLPGFLPESFTLQKKITEWAINRRKKGGAYIKIRLVKGANLALERVTASIQGWPQAPYLSKVEVDANFKRMLHYACIPEHARAVYIGIASHNLFDIAYALILRSEKKLDPYISFEMYEGIAPHIRRTIHSITNKILLYCPIAKAEDFQNAVAYFIRRLDENTSEGNFLRYTLDISTKSDAFIEQKKYFLDSCKLIKEVSFSPRKSQLRSKTASNNRQTSFVNEPDTEWSLPSNRKWGEKIIKDWFDKKHDNIPIVIDGQEIETPLFATGRDPSRPTENAYHFSIADCKMIETALKTAGKEQKEWGFVPLQERIVIMQRFSQILREKRADFIGVLITDCGKIISEADSEVSEAIDFAEYYCDNMKKLAEFSDLSLKPKGSVLVVPPWNYPCSIATSGIIAGLLTGNTVIFKPSSKTILISWYLAQAFWEAGISKKALQFISCPIDPLGNKLIHDPRINSVILTGSTDTAKHFLKMRPDLDLHASAGGKNAIIITAISDIDQAIRDLIYSAFSYSGQKCSSCSLAICEAEIYHDPNFVRQVLDAAKSLVVGSAWDLKTQLGPLIGPPNLALKRGLHTLAKGEMWILVPTQNPDNPYLWSPGLKLGVEPGSDSHQNEFFGPILSVMQAGNIKDAIQIANGTKYGLTSGLHSLDEREHKLWLNNIVAGNLFINRTIAKSVVGRQPFGGFKDSSFGNKNKVSGPNYLPSFFNIEQIKLPDEQALAIERINNLITSFGLIPEEIETWEASISSYSYWHKKFMTEVDEFKLLGQDNYTRYSPKKDLALRIYENDSLLNILRMCAASLICETPLLISWDKSKHPIQDINKMAGSCGHITIISESENNFIKQVNKGAFSQLRLLSCPTKKLLQAASRSSCFINTTPIVANGRIELLHFLKETSISYDYHRHGYLGQREKEERKQPS